MTDGTVTVRPPHPDDVDQIVEAVQASQAELYPWLPWATEDYGPDNARPWLEGELDRHPMVIVGPDGHIIGGTGLNALDDTNGRANLGYWLRTDANGNGYVCLLYTSDAADD